MPYDAPVNYAAPILIIDDSEMNQLMLSSILHKKGFTTLYKANDGIEALVQMEKVTPAIVLLDLVMPRMDGFEFCEKVRRDSRFHYIPVIACTALDDEAEIDKLFELGVADVIHKPINPRDVVERVTKQLQSYEAIHQAIAARNSV